ncbi:hypothetical protein ACJ70E_16020 [Pseudomonas plecoglossicida]|uniref:hypothetical protein n=1 Tax=Pseudomonas plecoglossicida TaxID=70775 RepID=UPI003977D30E
MKASEAKSASLYLVFAALVLIVLSAGLLAWKYLTAEVSGRVNAEVQIESAPSRIANYEGYFDQCAAIQGYEASLVAQKATLAGLNGDDANRVRTVIAGITAQRSRAIAQYNVDVRKDYTKARFLDSGLPKVIDAKSEVTVCAN